MKQVAPRNAWIAVNTTETLLDEGTEEEYRIAEAKRRANKDLFVPQGSRSAFIAPLLVVFIAFSGIASYFLYRPHKEDWKHALAGRGVTAPTLLISIDGLGHDYWRRRKDPADDSSPLLAPVLHSIATRGVHATEGMQPVMPTNTWPNHYAMVTGLYPETNGIVGDTMFEPDSKKWFHLSRSDPDWWSGLPIWYTLRKRPRVVFDKDGQHLKIDENYRTASVLWPGSDVDKFGADVFWAFNKSASAEDRISRAVSLLKGSSQDLKKPAHFVSLYFDSVELACQTYGPSSVEVNSEIEKVDKAIGSLLERLGPGASTLYNTIIVSDHGMADVSSTRNVNLSSSVKDGVAQDISVSPVGLFLNTSGPAADLFENIQKALTDHQDGFTVYRKEDLPERWHLRNSRRITPVVTLANKGWTLEYNHQNLVPDAEKAVDLHLKNVQGQSGFDNTLPDMQGLFVAEGPAFRPGKQVQNLRTVDMYEMLCFIFAVEPTPNNGTLETTFSSILKVK